LDVDLLLLRAEHQARVLERLEQRRGLRAAARDHRVDRVAGVAERALGEADQRVLVGVRMGWRGRKQQEERDYERAEAVVELTHLRSWPGSSLVVWRRRTVRRLRGDRT